MKTIIAIGGKEVGTLGKNGYLKKVVVDPFHRQILKRTGKQHPNVLYIPTAKDDSENYIAAFVKYYESLGCRKVEVLRLIRENPSRREICKKIASADAVYVNGGNTHRMMGLWKRYGVDHMLKRAYEQGTIMSGHSAGAICWFSYGDSDSFNKHRPFRVSAMGWIDAILCPHYDTEPIRQATLQKILKRTPGKVGLAIDECAALEIHNGQYRVLAVDVKSGARRTYWDQGNYIIEELPKKTQFESLSSLLKRHPST